MTTQTYSESARRVDGPWTFHRLDNARSGHCVEIWRYGGRTVRVSSSYCFGRGSAAVRRRVRKAARAARKANRS